jgi:hypothetical protein
MANFLRIYTHTEYLKNRKGERISYIKKKKGERIRTLQE